MVGYSTVQILVLPESKDGSTVPDMSFPDSANKVRLNPLFISQSALHTAPCWLQCTEQVASVPTAEYY